MHKLVFYVHTCLRLCQTPVNFDLAEHKRRLGYHIITQLLCSVFEGTKGLCMSFHALTAQNCWHRAKTGGWQYCTAALLLLVFGACLHPTGNRRALRVGEASPILKEGGRNNGAVQVGEAFPILNEEEGATLPAGNVNCSHNVAPRAFAHTRYMPMSTVSVYMWPKPRVYIRCYTVTLTGI